MWPLSEITYPCVTTVHPMLNLFLNENTHKFIGRIGTSTYFWNNKIQ